MAATIAGVVVRAFGHVQRRRVQLSRLACEARAPGCPRHVGANAQGQSQNLGTALRDRDGRYAERFGAAPGAAGAQVKVLHFRAADTDAMSRGLC